MNGAGFRQALRWRLRGLLRGFHRRLPAHPPSPRRIAYLFAGTYGDFVQALRPLQRLAAAFPESRILVFGADRYAREFSQELPPSILPVTGSAPWGWLFRPVDLLFANAVGVYRVRFDCIAALCARRAYGFRHAHESRRGGYHVTVPLTPAVRSFAEENLRLLDAAGVADAKPSAAPSQGSVVDPSALLSAADPAAWAHAPVGGPILFHIGSAGLKKDFGLKAYTRIIFALLHKLDGREVQIIMGPGDEDIALEIASGTRHVAQMFPLVRLIPNLKNFPGTVLCFNSFLAHLCVYLERPAIVMHREAVPYGYDCSPWHHQVILRSEKGWDPEEVLALLGIKAKSRN